MKIEGKDVEVLRLTLENGLKEGYRYVAIPGGKQSTARQAEQWNMFKDKSAANHFSYTERSRDGSIVDSVPIQAVKEQLERRIEFQQVAGSRFGGPQDVKLDIGLIQFQERARGEIFAEDITRQLKAHQILPDISSLKKNIEEDKQSFQIEGVRREHGTDKHFNIRVEQNEHRAFMIQAVEKMPHLQQQVKSEGLQVSLIKNDLQELQDRLQREGQNGHRFVAFPAMKVVAKEDFVAFKSAFGALQHAHENSTDRDHYIVRSIHVVQAEISKMMEHKKEAVLNPESLPKRSKGMDMSR